MKQIEPISTTINHQNKHKDESLLKGEHQHTKNLANLETEGNQTTESNTKSAAKSSILPPSTIDSVIMKAPVTNGPVMKPSNTDGLELIRAQIQSLLRSRNRSGTCDSTISTGVLTAMTREQWYTCEDGQVINTPNAVSPCEILGEETHAICQ